MVSDACQVRESFVLGLASSSRGRKTVSVGNRAVFSVAQLQETEYFWLCEACSAATTRRLTLDGRVVATGLANTLCNCPYVALNAVDRSMGRYSAASASFPEPIPRAPKDPSPKHPVIDVENRLRRNGSRELRPYKVSLHRLASEKTSIPG